MRINSKKLESNEIFCLCFLLMPCVYVYVLYFCCCCRCSFMSILMFINVLFSFFFNVPFSVMTHSTQRSLILDLESLHRLSLLFLLQNHRNLVLLQLPNLNLQTFLACCQSRQHRHRPPLHRSPILRHAIY